MKDLQTKGTGNSRYLKSAIGAAATWEEARALLVNGTFPVDLAGINGAGILQMGDALNKANLLSDETAVALGGDETMVPNGAFAALNSLIANLQKSKPNIAAGSYTGTGTYGSANKKTLTFDFSPKIVIVNMSGYSTSSGNSAYLCQLIAIRGMTQATTYNSNNYDNTYGAGADITWGENSISWYCSGSSYGEQGQLNISGNKYYYVAFG